MKTLPCLSRWVLAAACTMWTTTSATAGVRVVIDPASPGRVFEGLGALSAGASSRLLMDYPEPARGEILDYLFKPGLGAALHHLKVEIGGDVNSTDGTEPGFARTRDEFLQPRPEYFDRGYEWWLMREAKRRNPGILIDILQWGAPGWIGDRDVPDDPALATRPWGEPVRQFNRRKFYTQDNADYIAAFIRGAREHHGVAVDFCGIWNETHWDEAWIKRLRRTLDAAGLRSVGIVAADQCGPRPWEIARSMLRDPALMDAIRVIGAHYPGMMRRTEVPDGEYNSIPEARQTGKPLWSSEDGPWRGDWEGAARLARIYNRNYIRGRMTKTVIWSLVTSYYDTLPIPGSGPMRANAPWSGHYEIQPALWAIAHTTQFTQPGWRYLDTACGITDDQQVSHVTLLSPDGRDCSVILEAVDARTDTDITIALPPGLAARPLHGRRTDRGRWFEPLADAVPRDGVVSIRLPAGSICSLSTLAGQGKGATVIRPPAAFPSPYTDDFESSAVGAYARYFADQGGVFEVTRRPDGRGRCLRQMITRKGIDWNAHPTPQPFTIIGSSEWRNCEVRCDVLAPGQGHAAVYARIGRCPMTDGPPPGYGFGLAGGGRWQLNAATRHLASGTLAETAEGWHTLALRCSGPMIVALLDGRELARVEDFTFSAGMAGLASGYHDACFDDFCVQPLAGPEWVNLARGRPTTGSSRWADEFDARFATDGDFATRWNSQDGRTAGEWITIDFGRPTRFNRIVVHEYAPRLRTYTLQGSPDGTVWSDIHAAAAGRTDTWTERFPEARARYLRFRVDTTDGQTPSMYELEVFDTK
jgi:galactosylceramidase